MNYPTLCKAKDGVVHAKNKKVVDFRGRENLQLALSIKSVFI
jgi:hypothetical protein